MKTVKKFASSLGVALFWLALWQACAQAVGNSLIFPSPLETLRRLFELAATADFWRFTGLSLLRIVIGVTAAIPAAALISALCARSKVADRIFAPAVTLMKSVPVVSFILIAIFIISRRLLPSAITFTMIFPVLYENLREGIASTPKELLDMAKVFSLKPTTVVSRIYFPAIKPFFFSAICTSVGLAVKAGIAAEVVAYIPDSIGKNLSDAKSYMEPVDL
ncbi:MAG: ABC transporter permease, partial [Eubacteriales bacterium]